jgi:predicted dehydrogenase
MNIFGEKMDLHGSCIVFTISLEIGKIDIILNQRLEIVAAYRTSLEIYGTEGVIVLSNESVHGQLQWGDLKVEGMNISNDGNSSSLDVLSIPDQYHWVPDTIPGGPILNVAQALEKFGKDILEGTNSVPNFDDAVKLHVLLDLIQKAADTGERQIL